MEKVTKKVANFKQRTLLCRWMRSILVATLTSSVLVTQAHAVQPVNNGGGMGVQLVPTGKYADNRLMVKFRPSVSEQMRNAVLNSVSATNAQSLAATQGFATTSLGDWKVVNVPPRMLASTKQQLENNPGVALVEYDFQVTVQLTPNDPLLNNLWGMNNIGQTGGTTDADIDAPEAWDVKTNSDVVVAVIDTGIDYSHEDLAANMWTNPGEIPGNGTDDDGNGYVDDVYGYDFYNNDGDPFDDHGHGTHVAGTIGAAGNNSIGVAGVNWQSKIMAVKFLGAGGFGSTSGAILSVQYATQMGARVMNNSWGGGGFSQALEDAISAANDAGALFVAAAGNYGRNNDIYPFYPATYDIPNVVSVAATDHNDNRSSFSNYGATTVDLAAPGTAIFSTSPTGSCYLCSPSGYLYLNGTSMATPHVSGAAALIWAVNPTLSVAEVKDQLMNNVDSIPALDGLMISGGRLNLARALPPPPSGVDFDITAIAMDAAQLNTGEQFTVTITVKNHGTEREPYARTGIGVYLSLDPEITTDDLRIGGGSMYNNVLQGGYEFTKAFYARIPGYLEDIPADGQPHTYYIGAIVDDVDVTDEINEDNNSALAGDVGIIKDIDLTITSASVDKQQLTVGDWMTMSFTAANLGTSWLSSNWTWANISAYVSRDSTLSPDDRQIMSTQVRHFYLEPGESYSSSFGYPVQSTLSGSYYLILKVDSTDWEEEMDETNNTYNLGIITVSP